MKKFTIQRFSGLNGGKAGPFYNKKTLKKSKQDIGFKCGVHTRQIFSCTSFF